MGSSVNVAKYINAPDTLATRLDPQLLPPTAELINPGGINAVCPGRPSKNPAISTPPNRYGRMSLAYVHADPPQVKISALPNHKARATSNTTRNTAAMRNR